MPKTKIASVFSQRNVYDEVERKILPSYPRGEKADLKNCKDDGCLFIFIYELLALRSEDLLLLDNSLTRNCSRLGSNAAMAILSTALVSNDNFLEGREGDEAADAAAAPVADGSSPSLWWIKEKGTKNIEIRFSENI